ncbi:hypothetical protein BC332_29210 [Capsicum chinense]|nr:hypothetical protein BC332_29210 [Capsicum chinense]
MLVSSSIDANSCEDRDGWIIMTVNGGGDSDVKLVDGSFGVVLVVIDELVGSRNWSVVVDDDGAVGIGASVGVAIVVNIIRIMEVISEMIEIVLVVCSVVGGAILNVLFEEAADLLKMFLKNKQLKKHCLQIVQSDAENKQASNQHVRKRLKVEGQLRNLAETSDQQKNEGGEKKKKEGGEGNKKDGGNLSVVLKSCNCEGCATKVVKAISSVGGVEKVMRDEDSKKLTVIGKVDPVMLQEKVERETHKKVELVSPIPKTDSKGKGGGGNGGDNGAGEEEKRKQKQNKEKDSRENKGGEDKKTKEKEAHQLNSALLSDEIYCLSGPLDCALEPRRHLLRGSNSAVSSLGGTGGSAPPSGVRGGAPNFEVLLYSFAVFVGFLVGLIRCCLRLLSGIVRLSFFCLLPLLFVRNCST